MDEWKGLRTRFRSIYPGYLQGPAKRPGWLRVDRLFGKWGVPKDSPAGRQELARRVKARRRAEETGTPRSHSTPTSAARG
jgi:hypothetical protein